MTIIIVCGLKREARIIGRAYQDAHILIGGGNITRLETELEARIEQARGWVLSTGLAGALDPTLKPGDIVIDGETALLARLEQALPEAHVGTIIGSDRIVGTAAEKGALRNHSGALAVDMESHVAARIALRHGLYFAAVRVISDSAEETLPPAAQVGMRPDGGVALGAVLASLARNPAQLPALIRTGHHAGRAFRKLGRLHHMLSRAGIERLDPGKLALDMR